MKMYKKIIITSTITLATICIIMTGILISLDVSQTEVEQPADIIVSLAGGNGSRVEKAWELYMQHYSKADKLILTCVPKNPEKTMNIHPRLKYLVEHKEIRYEPAPPAETKNTWHEILYIKRYMQKHGYHSVIIVTDPLHVARVRMTLDRVGHFKEAGLEYQVIGYKKVDFVDSFLNDKGFRDYVLLEIVKRLGYEVKAIWYNAFKSDRNNND